MKYILKTTTKTRYISVYVAHAIVELSSHKNDFIFFKLNAQPVSMYTQVLTFSENYFFRFF